MRVKISTDSAKLFYLDRGKILKELSRLGGELIEIFSFVKEAHLFGSLARGDHRGLSDVDILVVVSEDLGRKNFWKVYRQVFDFFADRLSVSFDLILVDKERKERVLATILTASFMVLEAFKLIAPFPNYYMALAEYYHPKLDLSGRSRCRIENSLPVERGWLYVGITQKGLHIRGLTENMQVVEKTCPECEF